MTQPENDYPDCDRCDDTRLDPDAYIPHETKHGTAYWHAPCRDCQPETMGGDADVERAAEYLDDLATDYTTEK